MNEYELCIMGYIGSSTSSYFLLLPSPASHLSPLPPLSCFEIGYYLLVTVAAAAPVV